MLAYNRVNGVPAHTQPELVAEARSWTDESIAVVSDAGAPTFLVTTQRAQPDHVHAAAALVRSGLDSFTDNEANAEPTIGYLREALAAGLLTTDDIDRAVVRLLELRIRTGEFDGDDDPYAGIGVEAIDAPEARAARPGGGGALRRRAAERRRGAATLGRRRGSRSSDRSPTLVLTDWYAGTPPYAVGIGAAAAERYRRGRGRDRRRHRRAARRLERPLRRRRRRRRERRGVGRRRRRGCACSTSRTGATAS